MRVTILEIEATAGPTRKTQENIQVPFDRSIATVQRRVGAVHEGVMVRTGDTLAWQDERYPTHLLEIRITQYEVRDNVWTLLQESVGYFAKPKGVEIPAAVKVKFGTQLEGILNRPEDWVLNEQYMRGLLVELSESEFLVNYGLDNDLAMLGFAAARLGLGEDFERAVGSIDCLDLARDKELIEKYGFIDRHGKKKRPNLKSLWKALFGERAFPGVVHTTEGDSLMIAEIMKELELREELRLVGEKRYVEVV